MLYAFHHLCFDPCPPLLLHRALVVVENIVHLLQRPSHCLGNEEIHPDQSQQAEGRKENVRSEADGCEHGRGYEALCCKVSDVLRLLSGEWAALDLQ